MQPTSSEGRHHQPNVFTRTLILASGANVVGMRLLRLALVAVLVWIGGLKFANYEADGIVPLVANSPVMSFFYHYPAPDYRQHMNREGELKTANRDWARQQRNIPICAHSWLRDRGNWAHDCLLWFRAGHRSGGQFSFDPDVVHDIVVPDYYS